MAYLSDDELLDTEGGFTGWDDGTGAGAEETLEQALAEERLAELESELEQDEHPIDGTTKTSVGMCRWNIRRCRNRNSFPAG